MSNPGRSLTALNASNRGSPNPQKLPRLRGYTRNPTDRPHLAAQSLESRAQEAETKAGALNSEKQNLLKDINIISDTVSKNASTETIEIKQRNIREIIQKVTAVPDYELTYGIKTFAFMESLSGTLNIKNIKISDFLNISANICSNRRALTESITIEELSDAPTLISYSFYSPSGKINLNEILKK